MSWPILVLAPRLSVSYFRAAPTADLHILTGSRPPLPVRLTPPLDPPRAILAPWCNHADGTPKRKAKLANSHSGVIPPAGRQRVPSERVIQRMMALVWRKRSADTPTP